MGAKEKQGEETGKLSSGSYLSYGMAGLSTMLLFQIVSSYQTVFYTDVLGITAGAISAIMLIAKIWDAINDPMMGVIAERTKSRWGRFRPWLLWMAPISSIAFVLTFIVWPGSAGTKALLAGSSYILFGMTYTASGIPMQSLPTVMTRNPGERVKLYAIMGAASSLGGVAVSAVFTPGVMKFGAGDANSARGYLIMCVIVACIACITLLIAFKGTREIVVPEKTTNSLSVKESFQIMVKDRNLMCLLIGMILALSGVFGRVGIVVYYYMYVLERLDLVAPGITLTTVGMLIPYFFLPVLMKKIDVKKIMTISCGIMIVACLILYFAGGNTFAILFGTFMIGAGNWLTLCSQTMVSNIIDDNEVKSGIRTEGIMTSVISFSTKCSSAVGSAVGIALISGVGYIPNAVQEAAVKSSMNAVINLGPAVMFVVAMIPFMMIRMTNKKAEENARVLSQRSNAGQD